MPKLSIRLRAGGVKEINLRKDTFTIGRLPENDLEINDTMASRRHSKIVKKKKGYMVYDLKSANGTFLNKKQIKSELLKDGDDIQIGNTIITFKEDAVVDEPQEQPDAAPPSPPPPPPQKKDAPGAFDSDVVKSVGELSIDYRLNVKDIIASGQSISSAIKPSTPQAEGSQGFFILYHLGKAVATATTLDEVLNIAMSSIFDVIQADRGVIMLLDKETGKLTPQLTRSRDQKDKDAKPDIYVSSTITNKVINDKVSIITSDARHDPRFQSGLSIAQFNIRSALCVPLWEQQDILGVVYIDNLMKSHAFTNSDLELLTAIANQVAIRMKQDELHNSLKKEALVRGNLERYHSPDVVEMIIKQSGGEAGALDIAEKKISILFADIQNFTTLSEQISPRELAEMLNEFFETVTKVVFEFKGSINKYIGDAVLATFGAPIELPDHQLKAVKASTKMLKSIQELQKNAPEGAPKYNLRIGVNTGLVVAGNVGAKQRIEYAVLGDAVNIASRLNQYADSNEVAIGEDTYEAVKDDIKATPVGSVKFKGKVKEIQVYKLGADT